MGVLALLALLVLRGKRWAYFAFVLLGLLYFPAQAHFHIHAPKCELLLPAMKQLVPLLHNYAYIALFAGFYWMSWVQFQWSGARSISALVATLLVAAVFEVAEGMTAVVAVAKTVRHAKPVAVAVQTHCRVEDLAPAVAGALGAAVLLAIWARLTRKPAYVRLGKPHAAAAPRAAAPPPRPVVPPRAAPPRPVYTPPPVYAPPPPPPDFSPGPSPVTEESQAAPTEEVTPRKRFAARNEIVQRLQAILGRVRPMLQRIWAIILQRRRAVVGGGVLLVLIGAVALVMLRRQGPAVVATQQPQVDTTTAAPAPEPPPPRPIQAEVLGYYEPNYQFTVFDRRFSRLTLRPAPSVMFTRPGTRQEVACEDARVSPTAVHLRCQLEPYGAVTIEGRFASRYASGQLDMPVLSGLITVTNNRGEVVYRARDSFYWHVPD